LFPSYLFIFTSLHSLSLSLSLFLFVFLKVKCQLVSQKIVLDRKMCEQTAISNRTKYKKLTNTQHFWRTKTSKHAIRVDLGTTNLLLLLLLFFLLTVSEFPASATLSVHISTQYIQSVQ
jgi:hypothetical protein